MGRKDKNISMKEVKERTGLSSRQIRYYDKMDLIFPARSEGNQRLFSEDDIMRLYKIKELLEKGYKIETIKQKLKIPAALKKKDRIPHNYRNRTDKLTSLYPVSDVSYLTRILDKGRNKNNEEEE